MEMWFEVGDGVIRRAGYRTYGCPVAIACGSMTAQAATGRTIEQILRLTSRDIALLLGGLPKGKEHCPELCVASVRHAFGEAGRATTSTPL
jgi:NifU-like protein involved in Fe-S cluster formation